MQPFTIQTMTQLQRVLQDKYRGKWPAICPEEGRNKLLWLLAEGGEAAQILKKQGEGAVMNDPAAREAFVEELCDMLMYWNDILLCFDLTPEEVEAVYRRKHQKNLNRW